MRPYVEKGEKEDKSDGGKLSGERGALEPIERAVDRRHE